jgi:hypothetical protein
MSAAKKSPAGLRFMIEHGMQRQTDSNFTELFLSKRRAMVITLLFLF